MPTRYAPSQYEVPAVGGGVLLVSSDPLPPIPLTLAPGSWSYDADRRAFVETTAAPAGQVMALPPDLVLRAAEIDTADADACLAFISQYGAMGIDPTVRIDRGTPHTRSDMWRRREAFYGHAVIYHDEHERLHEERMRLRASSPTTCRDAREGYEGQLAFASAVDSLREAVDAWRAMAGADVPLPRPLAEAAEILAVVLDDALSVFAPRVQWLPDQDPSPRRPPDAPLFCVLALQLAHHVAVGESLRPCLGCGKLKTRAARDPATASFYRRGVLYCDDGCRNRYHTRKRSEMRAQERARRAAMASLRAAGDEGSLVTPRASTGRAGRGS